MIAQKKARRFQVVIYDGKNQELIETIYQAHYLQNSNIDFSYLNKGIHFLFKKKLLVLTPTEFEKEYEITEGNSRRETYTPKEMQAMQDAKVPTKGPLNLFMTSGESVEIKKQAIPDAMTLKYYEDSPLARINPDCLARCQHTQGLRRCDRDKDHPGSCVYNPNTIDKRTESYKDALNQEIMNSITENFIHTKDLSAEPYQVFMPVVTEDLALLEKENQTIETAKRQDKEMQPGEPVEDAGPAALDMVLKSELPTYVKVNLEEVYPKAVVPKGLDPYAWLEQKENEATVLSVKGVPLVTLLPGQHVIFERYTGGLKMDVRNSHEVESSNFLKSITVQDAANIRGNVTLGKKLPEYDENLPQAYPVTY